MLKSLTMALFRLPDSATYLVHRKRITVSIHTIVNKLEQSRERREKLEAARIQWQDGATFPIISKRMMMRTTYRLVSSDLADGVPALFLSPV
ncbi:MAG: hypothetical protein EOO77_48035 [Oxalobacteraceae bacterium]|nr:MAG: hypothetical protein EOO77_48035 [Oxalobacteraceae bacterium]